MQESSRNQGRIWTYLVGDLWNVRTLIKRSLEIQKSLIISAKQRGNIMLLLYVCPWLVPYTHSVPWILSLVIMFGYHNYIFNVLAQFSWNSVIGSMWVLCSLYRTWFYFLLLPAPYCYCYSIVMWPAMGLSRFAIPLIALFRGDFYSNLVATFLILGVEE